jgi:hypothetical protein
MSIFTPFSYLTLRFGAVLLFFYFFIFCLMFFYAQVVGSEAEIGGPCYMVHIDGLISLLQRRTVFSIASERFGFVSARIIGKRKCIVDEFVSYAN